MTELAITEAIWRCWRGSFTPIEQPLITWARQFQRPDKISVDAGADVGSWTVDMAEHSKVVWAFEPGPAFRLLDYNVGKLENVAICKVALGDRHWNGELYSSRFEDGGGSLIRTPDHHVVRPITVMTLDSYNLHNVAFIKMDVEGYEAEVLRGATELIRRERPVILFEVWAGDRGPIDILEAFGYRVIPTTWPEMYLGTPK